MVKWYWKCNGCGSIVIHFDNGTIKIKQLWKKLIQKQEFVSYVGKL